MQRLIRSACEVTGYGNLHLKLIRERTKTIGHGGDCCDFLLKYMD